VNRLAGEKSPYLLQHASNPVDWRPWGEDAFQEARRRDLPVFLSVGYSTCHWCHVMEHETFADSLAAAALNEAFVCIKVDREERPDIDDHFMKVSQMLTGTGGWPLTIVMTPDRLPFFAGTYIPRRGVVDLCARIRELWSSRRGEVLESAQSVSRELARDDKPAAAGLVPSPGLVTEAARALESRFDSRHGGFGNAPKFPMPTLLFLLLRAWKREGDPELLGMVDWTLASMRAGGIYDQVGFGFHRYSTDRQWMVPHFEKMLYDQALLALAYVEAWQATGRDLHRRTAREVCAYVVRDLALPGGGFASAEDADSEGEEGRFYLWSEEEIRAVLGSEDAAAAAARYGVSAAGNLEDAPGRNIFFQSPTDLAAPGTAEARLLAARSARVRPLRDDKVLADWNGLMIAALARAGSAFEDPDLVAAAEGAARFALGHMRAPDGRLFHRFREGEAAVPGFADDYAFLAWGLLELYGATFEPQWLAEAAVLTECLVEHFRDASGCLLQTADDSAQDVPRRASFVDGVVPSANSVGLHLLLSLYRLTGNLLWQQRAQELLASVPVHMLEEPSSCSMLVCEADAAAGPGQDVVIVGDPAAPDTRILVRSLRTRFLPNAMVLLKPDGEVGERLSRLAPHTAALRMQDGRATAYACSNFACSLPTEDAGMMLSRIGEVDPG
jgi:hypothetical protein